MVIRIALLAVLGLLLPACVDDVGDGLSGIREAELAAPGDLSARIYTVSQVRLQWTDRSAAETGHRLDVHTAPFDEHTTAVVDVVYLPANVTEYHYSAPPNRTLYFRMLALTDVYESDPSNTASIQMPPSAPKPYQLRTGPVTASGITVSWRVDGAPLGIRVERSVDGGAGWVGIYDGGVLDSIPDSGLLPGREYAYRVYSRDAYGLSLPSDPVSDATQSADWTVSTVASSSGNLGTMNAIAVREGTEYLTTYEAYPTEDLCLVSGRPGAAYTTRAIDVGTAGIAKGLDGTSIAIDAAGAWHAVGCESPGYDLRYITNASRSVVAATIDASGDTGHRPRIAISPLDGSIHVVYLERPGTLKRAIKRGTAAWVFESIARFEEIPSDLSFVLDSSGRAHVAFGDKTASGLEQSLMYATQSGSDPWALEYIGLLGIVGRQSLVVDSGGTPLMAYSKPDPLGQGFGLHLARRAGAWTSAPIHDRYGHRVKEHAIVISPSDQALHVAYLETAYWDLRYARKLPGQAWSYRVLDTEGSLAGHVSMAPGNGVVHIAYWDSTNEDLKRAVGGP